jgi:hypothetical protein
MLRTLPNPRRFVLCAALAALLLGALIFALPTGAQGLPPGFNEALADLGRRVGRTLTLADFDNATSYWEWRGVDFANSALECPQANETVNAVITSGYQIILVLRGRKYDYRLRFDDVSTLRLCTNPTGAVFETTPPARATANTEPPASLDAALADLGRRVGRTLTYDDFDNPTSGYTWRYREFRNSQLECPSAGQTTDNIVTSGWRFVFNLEGVRYDYRVTLNDPSTLFLCSGG